MKGFIFILSLLIPIIADAAEPSILELRNLFYQSQKDRKASELLCEKLEAAGVNDTPLLLAYKGIGMIMSAKHTFNPYSKLSSFNKGKNMLEQAIRRDAANPEVRFLRYCIQTQVPAILGYYSDIDEDRIFLLRRWETIKDEELKRRIRQYLLEYGNCTTNEKIILK